MIVANTYARALYQAAKDLKKGGDTAAFMDRLENQLDAVLSAVTGSKEAQVALLGPVATPKEKMQVVGAIAERFSLEPVLAQFLNLLARKNRLAILRDVREAFTAVRLEAEGGIAGRVVAADTLNPADVEGLAQAFTKKLGKKVAFRVSTDPSLLAGMKVTVNGVTYDGTLRSQLQRLRDRLVFGFTHGQA